MTPNIEFKGSPNRSARRVPITAIVIHHTGSLNIEGTIEWFSRQSSGVSAHYVVGRDGRIVQMVRETDVAWHAGTSWMRPDLAQLNPNDPRAEKGVNAFSIGIELVGTNDSGFTDRQLAALYMLLEILVRRYRIAPERIVGHAQIAPGRKIDPDGYDKQFPWQKARAVAQLVYNALPPLETPT